MNSSGRVRFDDYCAPKGVIVAASDTSLCCSRAGRKLEGFDDVGRVIRQGVILDFSFVPRVCK